MTPQLNPFVRVLFDNFAVCQTTIDFMVGYGEMHLNMLFLQYWNNSLILCIHTHLNGGADLNASAININKIGLFLMFPICLQTEIHLKRLTCMFDFAQPWNPKAPTRI